MGTPHESPSLVPQFPRRAAGWGGGRGTATLTFGRVAGKSPRLLCATAQAGTGSPRGYGQGTSVGTHPIACVPGLPRCHQPQPAGCRDAPEAGDCAVSGTVPSCPGSAPALGGFPGGKFHQTQSFPPGKQRLAPPSPSPAQPPAQAPLLGAACAGLCRGPAGRDLGIEGTSPGPAGGAQPGGPHARGQRGHQQPERWCPSPRGVSWPGDGDGAVLVALALRKPPLRRNEEGGAGSWLRPPDLPVLQWLRVAAGQQPSLQQNIYPSGTVPWTSLPPARPCAAKHGKAQLCAAKLGSCKAKRGKAGLWVAGLGPVAQRSPTRQCPPRVGTAQGPGHQRTQCPHGGDYGAEPGGRGEGSLGHPTPRLAPCQGPLARL